MKNAQFEADLVLATLHFPQLKIINDGNESFLAGKLDIIGTDGKHYATYEIEIKGSQSYPYYFPNLYETSNAFPKIADWHVYETHDKQCCVDIAPNIALKCVKGKNVVTYIKEEVIPYFANQSHRIKHGYYLYGEYAHGIHGLLQFYTTRLKPQNFKQLIDLFVWILEDKKIERQASCPFCGGSKFRKCHKPIIVALSDIKPQVLSDYNNLLAHYRNHKFEIDMSFTSH